MSSIQAGDVVVCVDAGPCPNTGLPVGNLKLRQTGRVESVYLWRNHAVLTLVGVRSRSNSGGFGAYRFRKVEKANKDFIAQIKACRPKQRDRVSS